MIPLEIEQWYTAIAPVLAVVKERVRSGVTVFCDENGFAYAGRDKTRQSLAEKLETGRVKSLEELDDLFGCSVIVPNLSYEPHVLEELGHRFDPVTTKGRHQTLKDPDVFRFEATRFIGRLRLTEADDEKLGAISFEIQVRTAFEHAWSAATHTPAYKSDQVNWKLERLAAQMKALVEQLDMLAVAYHQSAETLESHPCIRTDAESRILEWFLGLKRDGWIPEECEPAKWGLFAKNILALIEAADWGRRLMLEEKISMLNTKVVVVLDRFGRGKFPRTLSLFQFVLGALVETETISSTFRRDKYWPLISAAVEQQFPKTRDVKQRCDLGKPPAEPEPMVGPAGKEPAH